MGMSLGAYLNVNVLNSFSRGSRGNSKAWRRWSTGAMENGDRNTGATGK